MKTVEAILRFLPAIPAAMLPHRYWHRVDDVVPVSRAIALSALLTITVAGVIGTPAYFRYAQGNADMASDMSLQAAGWRPPTPGQTAPSQRVAQAVWGAGMLSIFTFIALTPVGLFCAYLGSSGLVRALATMTDDKLGDPILELVDAAGRRVWHRASALRVRRARERLEGPEVPDRLVTGGAVGFPDADYVVIASRRKDGWEQGVVFVLTSDKWYKLGTVAERQTPAGLRTLYPLTEIRTNEVLRRGVPYELPPLSGLASREPAQ